MTTEKMCEQAEKLCERLSQLRSAVNSAVYHVEDAESEVRRSEHEAGHPDLVAAARRHAEHKLAFWRSKLESECARVIEAAKHLGEETA